MELGSGRGTICATGAGHSHHPGPKILALQLPVPHNPLTRYAPENLISRGCTRMEAAPPTDLSLRVRGLSLRCLAKSSHRCPEGTFSGMQFPLRLLPPGSEHRR